MGTPYDGSPANFTEAADTLTNEAATIFAANPNRRGVIVANPSDTVMTLRIGGTADASTGIVVAAGANIVLTGTDVPSGALSLFCAGTAKAYTAYEW
jgi:hypothetical protein